MSIQSLKTVVLAPFGNVSRKPYHGVKFGKKGISLVLFHRVCTFFSLIFPPRPSSSGPQYLHHIL